MLYPQSENISRPDADAHDRDRDWGIYRYRGKSWSKVKWLKMAF